LGHIEVDGGENGESVDWGVFGGREVVYREQPQTLAGVRRDLSDVRNRRRTWGGGCFGGWGVLYLFGVYVNAEAAVWECYTECHSSGEGYIGGGRGGLECWGVHDESCGVYE